MKKLIMLIMAFCLIAPSAMAELSKDQVKMVEKRAKERIKNYKKEGWKIMGAEPLEVAVQKSLSQTMFNDGFNEMHPESAKAKSKNNARQMCLNQALASYVRKMNSYVQEVSIVDAFTDQSKPTQEEFDRFHNACITKSEGAVRGEIQESYTVYRELPDGRYEFEMNFIINEERAAQARQRAIADAAKESGLAQEYANFVADYVTKHMTTNNQ